MNVLLINDSSSNPNWGDRAAAIALKQMIVTYGGTISSVITEDELRDSRFFCNKSQEPETTSAKRSVKDWARLLLPPLVLKLRERLLHQLKGSDEAGPIPVRADDFDHYVDIFLRDEVVYGGLHDAIQTADTVVIHGDGCMVGNGILPRSELFLSYLIKTRFGKPVILINHTTDFSDPELNRMAEAVYPRLDDVTYRDQISADLCRDRWTGRYAADSAFFFEPAERDIWARLAARPTYFDVWPDQAPFDPLGPYVCVGGSSIYSFDGAPTKAIEGFAALVTHLRLIYSGQVVLTASDVKDEVIFRPVARALGLPLIALTTPVQQAVDIIGNADAYVGGRWHPGIFALRGGAPVIPLSSKTFKMQALIAMAGLPTTPFNALDLQGEKEKIGQALTAFVAQGEELRRPLRMWAAQQADNSWENMAFLRRWKERVTAGDHEAPKRSGEAGREA